MNIHLCSRQQYKLSRINGDILKISLGNLNTAFDGYKSIINIYYQMSACKETICEIDMSEVNWIDANMCAALGAVLQSNFCEDKITKISLQDMKPQIEDIFQKNGFLSNFGFDVEKKPDTYGTTIEYQRFGCMDSQSFKRYVEKHFRGKEIPDMTPRLAQKFRESISEIFENAIDHSKTQLGIFACGQYFPAQNRLDFSIADLGIGFRENIFSCLGKHFAPEEAIEWAMEGMNTTRRPKDGKPGGFGLKLIKEFLTLNNGELDIVSDAGYWSIKRGQIYKKRFRAPFPGTIVNIEINTSDAQSYRLESEGLIDAEDIF